MNTLQDYQTNNTKLYFKDFLSKKELRLIVNYHLQNRGKLSRFISYNKSSVIFQVQYNSNFAHQLSNFSISDINFDKKIITYSVSKKNYKHLVNEVLFYRRFPKSTIKQNGINFPKI